MKQVYSFRTGLEAHDFRFFLESHGIEAKVFGDNNAFEVGFALTPASAPGVYVNETDLAKAQSLIEEFVVNTGKPTSSGKWRCSNCGELNEASFEICWRCEAVRDYGQSQHLSPAQTEIEERSQLIEASPCIDVSTVVEPARLLGTERPKWKWWLEIIAILMLTQPFFVWTDGLICWLPETVGEWLVSHWYMEFMVRNIATFALVLLAIRLSGERVATCGLTTFNPLWDLFSGWFLMLITIMTVYFAADSFSHFLNTFPSLNEYLEIEYEEYESPSGIYGLVVLGATALCVALAEEIAFRGFLIPRFELLFGSTSWSVIICAGLFALIHVSQSLMGIWQAFVFGLLFGAVFVRFRRLWPLIIAHATIDLLVFVRVSS